MFPTYNKSAVDDFENIFAKLWENSIDEGTINKQKPLRETEIWAAHPSHDVFGTGDYRRKPFHAISPSFKDIGLPSQK